MQRPKSDQSDVDFQHCLLFLLVQHLIVDLKFGVIASSSMRHNPVSSEMLCASPGTTNSSHNLLLLRLFLQAENLEKCYVCDSPYDPTYTKGNMLFVCRGCMSQHRERESLDGRGMQTFEEEDDCCTGDEDCWCLQCMEKMPDDQEES